MNTLFYKIIDFKWYIIIAFGFVFLIGFSSLKSIKMDAIPDITNKQVVINTKTGAMDPSRIEKIVTYPIESALYGIPGLIDMRSISKFGLSQVVLIFNDNIDIYFAREQVLQKISSLKDSLPTNITPVIAPLTTGIGEIIVYRVYNKFGENNLTNLRTKQELVIARELKRVQGVAEVDTIGGFARELHLNVQSGKLVQYGMTPTKLINQIQNVGENYGGGYIEKDDKQVIVRTYPNLKNYDDIMNIPVKLYYTGRLIPVRELVDVRQDYSQRLGAATYNGDEAVLGTVMLQSGENAREVLINVKEATQKLNTINDDIQIEILYDRQFLIDSTIKVVMKNLAEGILLVVGVLCLLLGNLQVGLIVASCIPFCILVLAICMKAFGISANLMSLGAIDFGLLVDSSVVLVERIITGLTVYKNQDEKKSQIASLTASVAKPTLFGMLIIILVYTPILMFSGIEGKTFKPMAINIIIALIASLIIAFLLMPVLSYFFIKPKHHKESKLFHSLATIYGKMIDIILVQWKIVVSVCCCFFIISVIVFFQMPSDFLPELNEGDTVLTVVAKDGTSLTKTKNTIQKIEKDILQNPYVEQTFSKIGTSQSGLDPMPQNAGDIFVLFKNGYKENAIQISQEILVNISNKYTEVEITPNKPINMRFNEMLEGSRADISLRIFGEDLNILMDITDKISTLISGNTNVKLVERDFINSIRKTDTVDVIPNYNEIMRYQVNIAGMNSAFTDAMAGFQVGTFYANDFPISIILHIDEKNRNRLDSIRHIPIGLQAGGSFPLSNIADIQEGEDITSIPRIFGKRYSGLSIYLSNTDYAGFILKTVEEIKKNNIIPEGYNIEWHGRFKNLTSARKQIFTVIPIVLILICGILYRMFGNIKEVVIIFTSVPFGISGGVLLLFLCKIPITISVYIGFIALIGISLLNSIILLDTLHKSHNLKEACISRLRPILMTALVASLGFVPMAIGGGIGAEVQQPIAITVIGGIISSTTATLILIPVLVAKISRSQKI